MPWDEVDSLLVVAAMAFDLHDSSNRRELALDRLDRLLPADLVAVLAADGTQWDAPLWGKPRPAVVLPRPVNLSSTANNPESVSDRGPPRRTRPRRWWAATAFPLAER